MKQVKRWREDKSKDTTLRLQRNMGEEMQRQLSVIGRKQNVWEKLPRNLMIPVLRFASAVKLGRSYKARHDSFKHV